MKKLIRILLAVNIFIILFTSFSFAQIQDIKRNSNENKNSHSNSNNSNSNSSDNDNSDFSAGCLTSIFDLLGGCLSSLPEKEHDNVNNNPDDFVVVEPPVNNYNYQNPNNTPYYNNDSLNFRPKSKQEFSLDLSANFAMGFQYGTDSSYTYYDLLPGIRANLAWFTIDYRYNMLAEISETLPDAFKTWDLQFLINLRAADNVKVLFGTGMHYEEYSKMTFNQHFLGAKIGLKENRDYVDFNGRLTIDYATNAFPFNELAVNYNRGIINSKNVNGYISIGAIYQNYYEAVDIWALRAGIIINWHN